MEVASPLAFADSTGGAKRPLSYSPQLIDSGSHEMDIGDEPRYKRRRFHADVLTDNISPRVSHYGPSFHGNKSIFASSPGKKRNGLFSRRRSTGGYGTACRSSVQRTQSYFVLCLFCRFLRLSNLTYFLPPNTICSFQAISSRKYGVQQPEGTFAYCGRTGRSHWITEER